MEKQRSSQSGFSGIAITAGLSVLVLVGAIGWQITEAVQEKNTATSYIAPPNTASSGTGEKTYLAGGITASGESELGVAILDEVAAKYTALQAEGLYTEEIGESVAIQMAEDLKPMVPYRTYSAADIKTDSDTSANGLKRYGDDLRASLSALRKNTQPEFEIFGLYVDSKDEKYLDQLTKVAGYYREAVAATAKVVVPSDAVIQHLAILNAMEEFAATLDALVQNAKDPYASTALLRSYNQAESDMYLSFQALAGYYNKKNS